MFSVRISTCIMKKKKKFKAVRKFMDLFTWIESIESFKFLRWKNILIPK